MKRMVAALLAFLCPTLAVASDGGPYDADVGITDQAIVLRADFEREVLEVSVVLTFHNFSKAPVTSVDLQLCVPGDYNDLVAELGTAGDPQLSLSTRTVKSPHNAKKEWILHTLAFATPIRAGESRKVKIAYSIKKKTTESDFPFYRDKNGARELYLITDMNWLPAVFVAVKPGQFANLADSMWRLRLEYPDRDGLVGVADGRLTKSGRSGEWVQEEYRSWFPGLPEVLVAPYEVTRANQSKFAIEIYSPAGDQELLDNARAIMPDLVKIFESVERLYTPLPDGCVYRLVASHASNGGHGLAAGQIVDRYSLRFRDLRLIAHEMGHTWWGGLVASHGQGSKFLREAMAEFTSAWAIGQLHGSTAFKNALLRGKLKGFCYYPAAYAVSPQSPLVEQEGYPSQPVIRANYNRGATAVNAPRLELGDELFYRGLEAFLTEYRARRADIGDFTAVLSKISGRDLQPRIKEICWSPGFPTYRLVGLQSKPTASGYDTTVVIRNDGEIQAACPILLKTEQGEQREMFHVPAKEERALSFTTRAPVSEAIIDPDGTSLHFDPSQKLALWAKLDDAFLGEANWFWFNKSYALNRLGRSEQAVATLSTFLEKTLRLEKKTNMTELGEEPLWSAYLLSRALFHLEAGHRPEAEQDLRSCLPGIARAVLNGNVAVIFVNTGAVPAREPVKRLAELLTQATGHSLALPDDPAALPQVVQNWLDWWRSEGRTARLQVDILKKAP